MPTYRLFYRRYLPHFQPPGATLFLTFRLYGSIPREILIALQEASRRFDRWLAQVPKEQRAKHALSGYGRIFARWDAALAQAKSGPTWLADERVANVVVEVLHQLDGERYDLLAYCVMPNHVHVVFTPLPRQAGAEEYHPLAEIMQIIKGRTARQANQILGRQGRFWQGESYDHVIRDEEELERVIRYVLYNPVKAGLVQSPEEWRWNYCKWPV